MEKLLDAAISTAVESDPDRSSGEVPLTREMLRGHAAQVLLKSVSETDTLVVGSHGHGGFIGALLGSVSQHVVSHSRCPVVVVPAPQRTPNGEQPSSGTYGHYSARLTVIVALRTRHPG